MFLLPLSTEVYSKRKEFAPHFQRCMMYMKVNEKLEKLLPFEKIIGNLLRESFPFKLHRAHEFEHFLIIQCKGLAVYFVLKSKIYGSHV